MHNDAATVLIILEEQTKVVQREKGEGADSEMDMNSRRDGSYAS